MEQRINTILDFLMEIEKFKSVMRKNFKNPGIYENDAEHSWHLAMFLILFEKELPKGIDAKKTIKLALIHDLCELYAGDTFLFDDEANHGKFEREERAVQKLYSLLPADLSREFMDLFYEYEKGTSKEALTVKSFDKMQPILQNIAVGGIGWAKHGLKFETVDKYKRKHMIHDPHVLKIYEELMKKAEQQFKKLNP